MTTNSYRGQQTLKRGDGASPEVFTTIEKVNGITEVGKENELIDETNFDSGSTRTYIAGLADGAEISVSCNQILDTSSVQDDLIDDVDSGNTVNFQLVQTDGTDTLTLSFAAVCQEYKMAPSIDGVNQLNFTLKVSGNITKAYT